MVSPSLVPFCVSDGPARPESSSEGVRVLLGLAQPQVSKHLRVWVTTYQESWSRRFGELDAVLADLMEASGDDG